MVQEWGKGEEKERKGGEEKGGKGREEGKGRDRSEVRKGKELGRGGKLCK